MTTLQVLCTVSSLLSFALAAFYAWRAAECADRAHGSEQRLSIMRGQVVGLEASVVALDDRLKRLNGKVAREKRGVPDEPIDPTDLAFPPSAVCENWLRSQTEGPSSTAAKCECAYCESRRADRMARRASMRLGVKS